jgi:hypothetical protein
MKEMRKWFKIDSFHLQNQIIMTVYMWSGEEDISISMPEEK